MFQFFNIPSVNSSYYRPTIYRKRYDPLESYLINSIRQAQELERLKYILYNSIIHDQYKEEIKKQREIKNIQQQEGVEEKQEIPQKRSNQPVTSPIYYFESHSKFDGVKYIEERKERKIDSEGKIHQTLKRRLGEQWYETEQIQDKDGKTTNKETWHNVPENEIENFKNEWISKSVNKHKLTHDCDNNPEIKKEETDQTPVEPKEIVNEVQNEQINKEVSQEKESTNEDDCKETTEPQILDE